MTSLINIVTLVKTENVDCWAWKRERDITGIKSLKIGYNRIFGYYIEVTKANLAALPEGRYERKQTLANAERFITDELKEKETLILEAEEKIVQLEYDLFTALREEVKVFIPKLQHLAKVISELDVLQSFATVSEEEQFVNLYWQRSAKSLLKMVVILLLKSIEREIVCTEWLYYAREYGCLF